MARILIIDDESGMRSVLRRVLTRAGHETQEATDGKSGLKVLAESDFDLVITDIIMPEMEGIEFILRLHQSKPSMPIIAISGGGRIKPEGYLKTAQLAGAFQTLAKPFTIEELIKAVDDCLGGSQPPATPGPAPAP